MATFDATNSHFEYMDVTCHWSAASQKYAGGDALITFLHDGWEMSETVFCEEYWHAGGRLVVIYYFELEREGETLAIPVLGNPFVHRMVNSLPVHLMPVGERERHKQQA
jgi:hypothetical protein